MCRFIQRRVILVILTEISQMTAVSPSEHLLEGLSGSSQHDFLHMVYTVWDGPVPMLPLNTAAYLGRPRPAVLSLPDHYLHANVCWEKRSVSPVKFSLFTPMNGFQRLSLRTDKWAFLRLAPHVTELTLVHCSRFAVVWVNMGFVHLSLWHSANKGLLTYCICSYLISPLPDFV